MPFQQGNKANPHGRPPKQRALTAILEAELGRTIDVGDDKRTAAKRQIARLVTEFLATGAVTFPDGRQLQAKTANEYFTVVQWLYRHVDGEKSLIDVTTQGMALVQRVEVIAPADDTDAPAP
jgi:hypothetical protein